MTTSLSEGHERETSGFRDEFIGKTTNYVYMYICVNKQQSVGSSNSNVLSTGWWEAARARHEGECVGGCLLDEGADCRKTKVGSGLNFRRQTASLNRP